MKAVANLWRGGQRHLALAGGSAQAQAGVEAALGGAAVALSLRDRGQSQHFFYLSFVRIFLFVRNLCLLQPASTHLPPLEVLRRRVFAPGGGPGGGGGTLLLLLVGVEAALAQLHHLEWHNNYHNV